MKPEESNKRNGPAANPGRTYSGKLNFPEFPALFGKTLAALPYRFSLIDVNNYIVEISNIPGQEEFCGKKTCYALNHDTDRPCSNGGLTCPIDMVRKTGKPAVVEHIHIDARGKSITEEVHGYPVFGESGDVTHIIEIVPDSILHKSTDRALSDSEERFRVALKNSKIEVYNQDRGLRYTWIYNPQLGYRPEDIIGRTDDDFLVLHESARLYALKKGVLESGNGIRDEVCLTIKGKARYFDMTVEPLYDENGEIVGITGASMDITQRKVAESRLRLTARILDRLNQLEGITDAIKDILFMIRDFTGFEAVAIRLKQGDDYPYYIANGFPEFFIEAERYLCHYDANGEPDRDANGNVLLECMCGNIISGRTDPKYSFFTKGGSFWSNCTTELLASTTDEDRQARTRNRCNAAGYESVALIPLTSEAHPIGLIQFNDRRKGMFTIDLIEFFERIGNSIGIALSQKQAANALIAEKEKAERYLNAAGIIMVSIDAEQKVTLINKRGRLILGYEEAEMIGKKWSDICVPESVRQQVLNSFDEIISSAADEIKMEEYPIVLKSGEERIFAWYHTVVCNGSGRICGMLISGVDITEQKKAEEALQMSEERYARAQRAANIGSWDWNIETGELHWSDRIEPIFGFAQGEFGGNYEAFLECIHPDDRQAVIEAVNGCVENGRDYDIEHRIIWPDGSVKWVYETGDVMRNGKGSAVRMLGIVKDITIRKKAEEALQKYQEELERRVNERTRELAATTEELKIEREALERKNIALREILDQIDNEKRSIKDQITANVEQLIMPTLRRLKESSHQSKIKAFEILEKDLAEITSPFIETLRHDLTKLSPREIEICSLIKNGFSSKDIASVLNSSVQTVQKQRKIIRKKLGISNKSVNLTTFLKGIEFSEEKKYNNLK
ncbi:MAG: PAS domain-containing protein [Candidatus Zixiibacteriota bacterium]